MSQLSTVAAQTDCHRPLGGQAASPNGPGHLIRQQIPLQWERWNKDFIKYINFKQHPSQRLPGDAASLPQSWVGGIHPRTRAITFFTRSKFGFLSFDAPSRALAAIQVGLSLPYDLYRTWMLVQMSLTSYRSPVPPDTCMWGAKPCPHPAKPASTHLGSDGCKTTQRTPDATVPLAMLQHAEGNHVYNAGEIFPTFSCMHQVSQACKNWLSVKG